MTHVLLAGFSTRAAAESAARAGFRVTAIDAFHDVDLHASLEGFSLPRDLGTRFSAAAAARAARDVTCDAVAYLANFENHPRAVRALAAGRALWGNPPEALTRVRDPRLLADVLRRRGLASPEVRLPFDSRSGHPERSRGVKADTAYVKRHEYVVSGLSRTDAGRRWLMKPVASGGGRGVRAWSPGTPVPRGWYLQELIDGTPGSVVFVAAAGRTSTLAISRQLIGEEAFGSSGYRYCGNIIAATSDGPFARASAADAIVRAATEEFGLVGVNGIDFVARDGVPHVVELNPRWCGSMELVERLYGVSVFGAHAAACASSALPEFDVRRARHGPTAAGRAVVFARDTIVVGDTRAWLDDPTVRDIPHPGECIPAGAPICTVFATGADSASCHAALVTRAERVFADVGV